MLDAPHKFQEMLLEIPEFGQQEDVGAPAPASSTKHQQLGRSRSCGFSRGQAQLCSLC